MRYAPLLFWLASGSARAAPRPTLSVDALLTKEWKHAHVTPAQPIGDAGFLRRAKVDLTGSIPTPEEVTAFIADQAADKRTRLIDTLLSQPAHAAHFADYWQHLLIGREPFGPIVDGEAFREFLRASFVENRPWNALVESILTASGENRPGSDQSNGAVNYFLHYTRTPQDLSGRTARVFLGVQIQCAQCHNHPTEKWKQDDFRHFTAAFITAAPVPIDDLKTPGPKRVFLRDFDKPALRGPAKMELAEFASFAPTALDGTALKGPSVNGANRRQALAHWLTAPANPWFARAMVNRMWSYFLGAGFVEPIDDFRQSSVPTAPALLDRLTSDFIQSGFDLKKLIRTICTTRAYGLAASVRPDRLWSRHPLKPLTSEELYDALNSATNLEAFLARYTKIDMAKMRQNLRRLVTFLFDVDEETSESEAEGTIAQALVLLNGAATSNTTLALPGSVLGDLLADIPTDEKVIDSLYLRALSRKSSPSELTQWIAFVNEPREVVRTPPPPKVAASGKLGKNFRDPAQRLGKLALGPITPKKQAFEDLFWALINSSEFFYRH